MAQDMEARMQALEAQIVELQDREALRLLRYRYHECVNEGKLSEIPDLFTAEGTLDFGYLGKAKGKAELKKFFDALPRLLEFVKQFVHNHVVEVRGNTGTGFSYLEARTVSKGESYMVAARYDDAYVKENGEWKFTQMNLTPYFTVPLREGWAQADRLKMGR